MFASLCTVFASAELAELALGAVLDFARFRLDSDVSVHRAAVGRIVAARVLFFVITVNRVMIKDYRFEFLDAVGTFGIVARHFERKTAARRDFDSLERGSESVEFIGEKVPQVHARTVLRYCLLFHFCHFVCHNFYASKFNIF